MSTLFSVKSISISAFCFIKEEALSEQIQSPFFFFQIAWYSLWILLMPDPIASDSEEERKIKLAKMEPQSVREEKAIQEKSKTTSRKILDARKPFCKFPSAMAGSSNLPVTGRLPQSLQCYHCGRFGHYIKRSISSHPSWENS